MTAVRVIGCALALIARVAAADTPPGDVPPAPTPEPIGETAPPPAEQPAEEQAPAREDDEMRDKPALRRFSRREIVVNVPGERERNTVYVLSGLAGGGALLGAIGLYFHMSSRSDSDKISASKFTGRAWTPENQALYDSAERSKTRAAVFYGAGTLLVGAAIVGLIVTDPKTERHVIRPHVSSFGIAPLPGGAIAGGGWTW